MPEMMDGAGELTGSLIHPDRFITAIASGRIREIVDLKNLIRLQSLEVDGLISISISLYR
jgi:hypothetical protein